MAKKLNNFFATVGQKLADKIKESLPQSPPMYHTVMNDTHDNITSIPISEDIHREN